MAGLINGDPLDSATVRARGVDALESTTGAVQGATAGAAWALSYPHRYARGLERRDWELSSRDTGEGNFVQLPEEPLQRFDPLVPVEELNEKYRIPGMLQFDKPTTERIARELHGAKMAEAIRQGIVERRPDTLGASAAARFGIGLAVGLIDPLNIAAGFMPVMSAARAASLVASAGSAAGRTGIRAGIGGVQGAAGMAVLEPANILLDQTERNDWHMNEALANIAFGTLLGGGLHAIGGGIHDNPLRSRNRLTRQAEAAGPEARAAALEAGIAEHVAGGPVTAPAHILDTALLRSAFADRLAARGETTGGYAAYTPSGIRVELRSEVVDAAALIVSHQDSGHINPAYPHAEGMQPRDRTSAASQAQIQEMASRLEPERLGPSPDAATGAPIVNAGGVVESGNGRVLTLRRVHGDPAFRAQAEAYRAYLEARGHDTTGMAAPVLIGRRVTAFSPEETRAFAIDANVSPTLRLSAAEQARADVGRVGKAIAEWNPGPLDGPANTRFIERFMAGFTAVERGDLLLRDGRLSSEGHRRIQAALLAHAYGDALGPVLERMLNGDTAGMKAVAGALSDVSGAWGHLRDAAARGEIPAGLDITADLGEAVRLLEQSRRTGVPLADMLAQTNMLDGPSPAAAGLVRLMFRDDLTGRLDGRQAIAGLLTRYVDQALEAKPGPGLFGEAETTAAQIMRTIGGTDTRAAAAADGLEQAGRSVGATPEGGAASDAARAAAERAGKSEAGSAQLFVPDTAEPPALREARAEAERIAAVVDAEVKAGRLTEADLAPLREADALMAEAEAEARAMEAASQCLLGRL